MAGKDRGPELPRRIRGTAWTEPLSPDAPVVPVAPAELRRRMQEAVTAERADAVFREQERSAGNRAAEPPWRVPPPASAACGEAGAETAAPGNGANWERTGAAVAEPAVRPEPVVKARTTAEPEPAVSPQTGKPQRGLRAAWSCWP